MINRYEILAANTRREFPRFTVKERSKSWLGRIFWLLQKITRQDYGEYTTTIFSTMYVESDWATMTTDEKYKLLRHEKKHIEQFHKWPLGRWAWPINHLIVALCYLFLFPVFWTMRAKFEREGYTQTMLVDYELAGYLTEAQIERNAAWMAQTFSDSSYFFMWRRKAAYAWAVETMRKIRAGEITNPTDRVDEPRVVPPELPSSRAS